MWKRRERRTSPIVARGEVDADDEVRGLEARSPQSRLQILIRSESIAYERNVKIQEREERLVVVENVEKENEGEEGQRRSRANRNEGSYNLHGLASTKR